MSSDLSGSKRDLSSPTIIECPEAIKFAENQSEPDEGGVACGGPNAELPATV